MTWRSSSGCFAATREPARSSGSSSGGSWSSRRELVRAPDNGGSRLDLDTLDLGALVRPGDTVLWGQSVAEPVALTRRLMAQRAAIGGFRCFLGMPASDTCRPEHTDLVSFVSYIGSGANRALYDSGRLQILPVHFSELGRLVASGRLPIDVVMLLVPPPDDAGRFAMGLADEYLSAAADRARIVVAEVNDHVPRVGGGRVLEPHEVDYVVESSRPLLQVTERPAGEVEQRVAAHVAGLVEDGATLQIGVGAMPTAALRGLDGHRDLGIHSGMIGDAVADLMEAGVITGARKSIDRGLTVAGVLMGSDRLFRYADAQPRIALRAVSYTHDPQVLAAQHKFVAINSALQVDLTGQINSEGLDGRYLGAIGGAVDFIRGAARATGGVPVTVLASTAGEHSRIVAELSGPVSTARSDAGLVVTEHGVADLRGLTLSQRHEALLAVAHPDHRDRLADSIGSRR
ncbi:MAG: acetyl-CoA hydrolase [Pseudonocardiaceae bacterium]|nr:acetyl-CoA hydrolase [Pseudonocardiaceae bacterium]